MTGETEALGSLGDRRNALAAPKPGPERLSVARAESTELERRALALERILQALIAHMAEADPKLLVRLADTFCVPMQMARSEHDYTDTDSYAAAFIRSVVRLGGETARKPPEAVKARRSAGDAPSGDTGNDRLLSPHSGIRVRQAGGVWHVTKDGRFYGDFFKERDALAAVKAAGGTVAQRP